MRRTRSSRSKTSQDAKETEDVQSKTACALLDSAVSSGETSVTLALASETPYEVDLKKMVQINPVTKYKRKIRSHPVKPEGVNDAGDSTAQNGTLVEVKEEEEETEQQPVAKKKRGGKSQAKSQKMPKEEVKSEEVVRTVVMKGKAPVDIECKAKLGKAYVYSEGKDVYDVMLNQTNLQFNNNKYYLIQLLQDDSSKAYSVWARWGRVGKVGQNSLTACGSDLLKAKDIFKKKFTDKTKNEWEHRATFDKVAGKYDMVYMDYSTNEKANNQEEENTTVVDAAPRKRISKLNEKLQSLMELICDIKAMEEFVLEMKFDTRKAPLGQLKTPPVIRTEEELKEKISLLESSGDSEEHPVDRQYSSLQCQLQPLDSGTNEFQVVEKYLQSTHATTHNDYTMTVLDIFSVDRAGETSNFLSQMHNSQGLRFGKGIYFADMSSKSANYCFANQNNHTGLLLLSEVALGDCNELVMADYEAQNLPAGKHSTKGLGQTGPDPKNAVTLYTGASSDGRYHLLYNEFIVYNPAQTRMKYLLRIKFNYSSL
ncbi:hypothetical protein F7725_011137, partial [Dissostichus mawsoni]